MATVTICDRCRKELPNGRAPYRMTFYKRGESKTGAREEVQEASKELCEDCAAPVLAALESPPPTCNHCNRRGSVEQGRES